MFIADYVINNTDLLSVASIFIYGAPKIDYLELSNAEYK